MSHLVRLHYLAIALLLVPVWASAESTAATVSDGWFRALPSGLPAGGYFALHNKGNAPITLTGASSPACGMLMLHQSQDMGGMSHMEHVGDIDVPAGGELKFAPGGYHLMCMDPAATMKPGGTVKVTLAFKGGAKVEVDFAVRNASGQ